MSELPEAREECLEREYGYELIARSYREERLECKRDLHKQGCSIQSQTVQIKTNGIHAHLASLEIGRCTTCLEAFPGLRVNSHSIN